MRKPLLLATVCLWLLMAWGKSAFVVAEGPNLLTNGDFEDGFAYGAAVGWQAGNSGKGASFEYAPGERAAVGAQSQVLIIHTQAVGGSERDLYSWITQQVQLEPGITYQLSLQALVQSTEGSEQSSHYNYRLQVGFGGHGLPFPWDVADWIELPTPEWDLAATPDFGLYQVTYTPAQPRCSVFVRAWKKFPTVGQRAVYIIDDVRLEPLSAQAPPTFITPTPARPELPRTGGGDRLTMLGVVLGTLLLLIVFWRLYRLSR